MKEAGKIVVAKALRTMLEKEIGVTYVTPVICPDSKYPAEFIVTIFGNDYCIRVSG